jgi:hypothetical protein
MQEKENVLRILVETKKAIQENDSAKLKILSDQTIHTASTTQDPDNIAIAVIVYSLSKIVERPSYQEQKGWEKFYASFIANISHSIDALKKGDGKHLGLHLEDIRKRINGLSGNLKKNIQDVFAKASINKASKIYEHGISMGKTAKLLGISVWELADYSGQSYLSNQEIGKTLSAKQRIKLAEEIFG